MKRVLFVAYLYPPILNSGTQRPLKFSKYLVEYGWQPTVLTAAHFEGHPTDESLLSEIPAGVKVVRVPMLSDKIGDAAERLLGGGSMARKAGAAIRWRMRKRWQSPDLYASWRPTAFRKAMQIFRDQPFDAIYATGYPWTSLLAATDIAKATGRPLIADFRDLWVGENLFRQDVGITRDEEKAYERQIVDAAHRVTTVSAAMTRWMIAAYPDTDERKFATIHNGFDPADIEVSSAPRADAGTFRIVFTGVWKDGYNPSELYDSIDWIRRSHPQLLDGVEVVMAGFTPGEAARRGLSAHIKELGYVPHHEAVSLMRSADVLFLSYVDRERQWAVPGKLYEYLATGRPVLALTPNATEVVRIIERVGGGITVSPDDPGDLYQVLAKAFESRRFDVPARRVDELSSFERRQLTGKLAALLDEATERTQPDQTALSIGSTAVLATRSS